MVAVLEATGTANDRSVFLNLEGFYAIDGHEKPIDEAERDSKDFYASEPEVLEKALAQIADYRKREAEEEASGANHDHGPCGV